MDLGFFSLVLRLHGFSFLVPLCLLWEHSDILRYLRSQLHLVYYLSSFSWVSRVAMWLSLLLDSPSLLLKLEGLLIFLEISSSVLLVVRSWSCSCRPAFSFSICSFPPLTPSTPPLSASPPPCPPRFLFTSLLSNCCHS